MSDQCPPSIFERPANDAPWWVLPILTLFTGCAVTSAVLLPVAKTPGYLRGHAEGFDMGFKSATEQSAANEKRLFAAGVEEGRRLVSSGR